MASVTTSADAPAALALPFTLASRTVRRFAAVQTANMLAGAGSLQPIPLPAVGWVRAVELEITVSYTTSASAAIVTGDSPWNALSRVSFADAAGTPLIQAMPGYSLYLKNKYIDTGWNMRGVCSDPRISADYAFSASGTSGTASFRLFIVPEQDPRSGYGCIPNLDANASPILRIDYPAITTLFSGGTASAGTLQVKVYQHFYAPTSRSMGGVATAATPPGAGDYEETRWDSYTVNAATENLTALQSRGGFVKAAVLVSRNAGVRTAFTAGSNVGVLLDNIPLIEGQSLESYYDGIRRQTGFFGPTATTSYAPLTAGTVSGLDAGVLPILFYPENGRPDEGGFRDGWLPTKVGSLLQVRHTPGASATQLEVITGLMQVRDAGAFVARAI